MSSTLDQRPAIDRRIAARRQRLCVLAGDVGALFGRKGLGGLEIGELRDRGPFAVVDQEGLRQPRQRGRNEQGDAVGPAQAAKAVDVGLEKLGGFDHGKVRLVRRRAREKP